MLRNTAARWGRVSKLFHWGIALIILIEVPAGFVMSRTYGAKDPVTAAWQYWTSQFHHSAGMMMILLILLRAFWRLAGPVPVPLGMPTRAETVLARATHWLMYALLLLIPLSGWAALSSLADTAQFVTHLWFFGFDGFGPHGFVPRIVPPVPWDSKALFRYGFFAGAHRWFLIAGAMLLLLHIAAALRHHLVLRDQTLRRMLSEAAE